MYDTGGLWRVSAPKPGDRLSRKLDYADVGYGDGGSEMLG